MASKISPLDVAQSSNSSFSQKLKGLLNCGVRYVVNLMEEREKCVRIILFCDMVTEKI